MARDTIAYNTMIACEYKKGSVENARWLFQQMEDDHGARPNAVTFTTMISGEARRGNSMHRVKSILQNAQDCGVRIDSFMFTSLLLACRNLKDEEYAKELVDLLFTERISLKRRAWEMTIGFLEAMFSQREIDSILSRYGACVEEIPEELRAQRSNKQNSNEQNSTKKNRKGRSKKKNESEEDERNDGDSRNLKKNFLEQAKKGNLKKARHLFAEMAEHGDTRDSTIYNALLRCEARDGTSMQKVKALFREMQENGTKIDSYTLTALFTASRNFSDIFFGEQIVGFLFSERIRVSENAWMIYMQILQEIFSRQDLQSLLARHGAKINEVPAFLLARSPQESSSVLHPKAQRRRGTEIGVLCDVNPNIYLNPKSASCKNKMSRRIVGLGSNVVDVFFRLRAMPVAGTKGYFHDPLRAEEGKVVGGVTLNHLSWAAALGANTALCALQGQDSFGETIREKMAELGVGAEHVKVGRQYATSLSHILLDRSGERAIIMAPASTGTITADVVEREFRDAIFPRTL